MVTLKNGITIKRYFGLADCYVTVRQIMSSFLDGRNVVGLLNLGKKEQPFVNKICMAEFSFTSRLKLDQMSLHHRLCKA